MDSKNKNILIGGLLAIVLVMAVGYAAFATQLQINGTAQITSSWNVHFDTTKTVDPAATTNQSGKLAITPGSSEQPSGSITFTNDTTANVAATLKAPGDSVQFTLTIVNDGTINATKNSVVLALDSATATALGQNAPTVAGTDRTVTIGHIKFDITEPATSLPATSGSNTTTMTVTATYVAGEVTGAGAGSGTPITGNVTSPESAGITVTIVYAQATS